MAFIRPIDLPNKQIRCRRGYDGHEPVETLRAARHLSKEEARCVVAISSDYSGSLCDGYVNKDIIALVQRAITENGMHIICEDIFCSGGDMPEEQPGTLALDEGYVLVSDDMECVGRLKVWMYSATSGGAFYNEFDPVIDMIVPGALCNDLMLSVNRLAAVESVHVDNFPCVAERPRHDWREGVLGSLVRWLK